MCGGVFLRKKRKAVNIKLTVLFSELLGLSVSLTVLFLVSAIAAKIGFTEEFTGPLSTTALLVGNFMAGVSCGYKTRKNGLLCGLYCGAATAAVCLIGSIFFGTLLQIRCLKLFLVVAFSALGGAVGVNIKKTEY